MFERLVLLSLALGVLNTFLSWDHTVATLAEQGVGTNSALGIQAVVIGAVLLLTWLIARKASPAAKWIYVVLSVLGIVLAAVGLGEASRAGTLSLIITVVQYLLTIVSLWLLFRPDAKGWFNDGRGGDDEASFH
jgi:phosphoglycerol transferase MdoB-like AlkP superfamily enzyme